MYILRFLNGRPPRCSRRFYSFLWFKFGLSVLFCIFIYACFKLLFFNILSLFMEVLSSRHFTFLLYVSFATIFVTICFVLQFAILYDYCMTIGKYCPDMFYANCMRVLMQHTYIQYSGKFSQGLMNRENKTCHFKSRYFFI